MLVLVHFHRSVALVSTTERVKRHDSQEGEKRERTEKERVGTTDTGETYVLELHHRNPHLDRKLAGEK